MSEVMDQTHEPEAQGRERRRERRAWVAGIAVVHGGGQTPSVWRVENLSLGGASLVGDGALPAARLSLELHVAGFPGVAVQAKVLRRQLVTRAGRSAVKFVDASEVQRQALREILAAEHTPAIVRRGALVVDGDGARAPGLSSELTSLGFSVHRETSPEQAAAWLQRETPEILLLDASVIQAHRWSLLQFVRDTAPEVRRFVLAGDVLGFRLYYAIKAGLVDGLVEPKMAGEALARRLLGAAPAPGRSRGRAAARRAAHG
jgi:ActR/RegA family two-component response regulator